MSVLLQSIRTNKYLIAPNRWTEAEDKAATFVGGMEALMFCYEHRLGEMQILGRFGDPKRDFTIPLTELHIE